ncbi:MAG: pyridoxine 5'-phosphate synthase [Candidatus Krumholzibacteria bacterium]|nr:pyridoxine 5'-phosphate synthase [Candidatus Krumholzibacteria bacterium]
MRLGVNVDHVATIREARKTTEPDPVTAAMLAEQGGADQITLHLREDRRHIQNRDARLMSEMAQTMVNLEMAATSDMQEIALALHPDSVTLVPERREEVTTEGGLDVAGSTPKIGDAVKRLSDAGIIVSLFTDPDEQQVAAAAQTGAQFVELHTGAYANARNEATAEGELAKLVQAAEQAVEAGPRVNAGHGLNYINVRAMHRVPELEEVNIGHSIISRAVFVGLERAIKEMLALLA